jgi:hypothetical protein
MLPDVQSRFSALERMRQALLDQLHPLTAAQLRIRPGPDRWSVLEAVEHVVLSEEGLLREMLCNGRLPDSGLPPRDPQKFELVLGVLSQDIPVDVPVEEVAPSGGVPLEELKRRWESLRTRLRERLDNIGRRNRRRPVCLHPIAGPLDARETLEFMKVHCDGHRRQVARILDDMQGAPGG